MTDACAEKVQWGKISATNLQITGHTAPGLMTVEALRFDLANGKVAMSGQARAAGKAAHVVADAMTTGIDLAQVVAFAATIPKGDEPQAQGALDAQLTIDMRGDTLQHALGNSRGQFVLTMNEGEIARDLLEKASTDLRAIFRKGEGMVAVSCLLGIGDLRDGVVTIAPLRLRTADVVLTGGGKIDLPADTVDIVVQSRGGGALALGVPIRMSGHLSAPVFGPMIGSVSPTLPGSPALSSAMLAKVSSNACRQ